MKGLDRLLVCLTLSETFYIHTYAMGLDDLILETSNPSTETEKTIRGKKTSKSLISPMVVTGYFVGRDL